METFRSLITPYILLRALTANSGKLPMRRKFFPSDQSLLKSLYLVVVELKKKWSRSAVKNWNIIYGQLSEIFGEKLEA